MRALCLVPLALSLVAATPDEIQTTQKDQKSLAVTIYNSDLALVKDQRTVRLPKGDARLAFQEVSAQIKPETALLRSLTEPKGFWVAEQNFDFDLLTPEKLLDKYVGRQVTVVRQQPNPDSAGMKEIREQATVLSTNNGIVLQYADRIETGVNGRLVYSDVPANLRARPTLVTSLHSGTEKTQTLELSYLTGGLGWKADYVTNLASDEKTMDLSGWVTLTNQSGIAYPDATLQLVAGDVNRVQPRREMEDRAYMAKSMAAPAPAQMAEQSLFEYHLYTLDRPTTIAANQTKQVALLSASAVPVVKELVLEGAPYYYESSYGELGDKLKVAAFVTFDNREANHLGMPLPKGIIRVYKQDSEGRAQFVGEDNIDHTPKNETVRIKLGESFDVTGHRKQTDFKNLGRDSKHLTTTESAYEIRLKNAKKETAIVIVREPVPGDWEMLSSSLPYTKPASGTAEFKVPVPAEGETVLTYRVRVKW
ncbi:MAG TPA: DUF4139 domain-containing protein [Holophagaceae bacterium]|jgi:hypothetical protein|nr:DUF4139 domain-containing protein [Holophagaceae bacterium]